MFRGFNIRRLPRIPAIRIQHNSRTQPEQRLLPRRNEQVLPRYLRIEGIHARRLFHGEPDAGEQTDGLCYFDFILALFLCVMFILSKSSNALATVHKLIVHPSVMSIVAFITWIWYTYLEHKDSLEELIKFWYCVQRFLAHFRHRLILQLHKIEEDGNRATTNHSETFRSGVNWILRRLPGPPDRRKESRPIVHTDPSSEMQSQPLNGRNTWLNQNRNTESSNIRGSDNVVNDHRTSNWRLTLTSIKMYIRNLF